MNDKPFFGTERTDKGENLAVFDFRHRDKLNAAAAKGLMLIAYMKHQFQLLIYAAAEIFRVLKVLSQLIPVDFTTNQETGIIFTRKMYHIIIVGFVVKFSELVAVVYNRGAWKCQDYGICQQYTPFVALHKFRQAG